MKLIHFVCLFVFRNANAILIILQSLQSCVVIMTHEQRGMKKSQKISTTTLPGAVGTSKTSEVAFSSLYKKKKHSPMKHARKKMNSQGVFFVNGVLVRRRSCFINQFHEEKTF